MKIYIRETPMTMNNEIFMITNSGKVISGDNIGYMKFSKDGKLEIEYVKHNAGDLISVKPTMIMNEELTRGMIQAFMELGKSKGINPPNESKCEGMLESQTKHLGDLRQMLKLK